MGENIVLGIDAGFKKAAWAFLNQKGDIIEKKLILHSGDIEAVANKISEDSKRYKLSKMVVVGSLGGNLSSVLNQLGLGNEYIPSQIAQEEALKKFYPDDSAINLVRLGASGYSLLAKNNGSFSFHLNSDCSSGTGLSLETFCKGFNLSVQDACQLILSKINSCLRQDCPKMNTRCAVMMKTERVHATNNGESQESILWNCFRSMGNDIGGFIEKHKTSGKVLVIGGVANVLPIMEAIRKVIGVAVEVLENRDFFEAIGAGQAGLRDDSCLDVFSFKSLGQEEEIGSNPPLLDYLDMVTVYEETEKVRIDGNRILSLDNGSTGIKLAISDVETKAVIYSDYYPNGGNPIGAIKKMIKKVPFRHKGKIAAMALTGSGRYAVERVLRAVFPELVDHIFVEDEVTAHTAAAIAFDPDNGRDATIVDIGGQDSKYVRVIDGKITDHTLNHACSAGTGSFLEELGAQFGVKITKLGRLALQAKNPLDFGEKCTVFFINNVATALQKGFELKDIFAGAYYSVAMNYVRGVVGDRNIGGKIILQGTPALNIALPCALTAITGMRVIIPPDPGKAGAGGAAIRAISYFGTQELLERSQYFNIGKILKAQVVFHETIRCRDNECNNLCFLDKTVVKAGGRQRAIISGGLCDKYEGAANRHKLPQDAPNAFRQWNKLWKEFTGSDSKTFSKGIIGIPKVLAYVRLIPFFAAFFNKLGFAVKILEPDDDSLERGNRFSAGSEICAPLKIAYGLNYSQIDYLFVPKIGSLDIESSTGCCTCPIIQAAPETLLFGFLGEDKIIKPVMQLKGGFKLKDFLALKKMLPSVKAEDIKKAFADALIAFDDYNNQLLEIGKEVIDYAQKNKIPVVLIQGRLYLVHDKILNSGIPDEVRKAGALALPVDCWPDDNNYDLASMYWGEGQLNLRMTIKAVSTRNNRDFRVYPLWITCFNCGPDSFNEHFFKETSHGHPSAMIQVDGHSKKLGYNTRIEVFTNICREDMMNPSQNNLSDLDISFFKKDNSSIKNTRLLIPPMGDGNKLIAAVLRSCGMEAKALPVINREIFNLGRKFATGKECGPCIAIIGSFFDYLRNNSGSDSSKKNIIFLPTTEGPCRFGMYSSLMRILLKREGYDAGLYSLSSADGYGTTGLYLTKPQRLKLWAAVCIGDLLKKMLYYIRPMEKNSGDSEKTYNCLMEKFVLQLEKSNTSSFISSLKSWGLGLLMREAVATFKRIKIDELKQSRLIDIVLAGEIYVRNERFLNGNLAAKLGELGVRADLAPIHEWIDYVSWCAGESLLDRFFRWMVKDYLYGFGREEFNWPIEHSIGQVVKAGKPYIGDIPQGEAILSIGTPLLQCGHEQTKGSVIIGPTGCMPTRIAELQFIPIAKFPNLIIYVDGTNRINEDRLGSYAWLLHSSVS